MDKMNPLLKVIGKVIGCIVAPIAFLIALPINLAVLVFGRKECPQCGKRTLRGVLVMDEHLPDGDGHPTRYFHNHCSKCGSEFRFFLDGRKELIRSGRQGQQEKNCEPGA